MSEYVYELVDYTREEIYYTIGIWATFEAAEAYVLSVGGV